MRESEIHSALMAYLKKNALFYVHSTFGKKATMTKDAPDFVIIHAAKAILVEVKTEKGSLTPGQKESFARIQERSGMVVHVVRSVEQAVLTVENWLGIQNEPRKEGDAECPQTSMTGRESSNPSSPTSLIVERNAAPTSQPESAANLFIGNISGRDHVLSGDSGPGGSARVLRVATPADLINLPRR